MIPRILHRIWLDDPMPAEFADYGEQLRALHPAGWEVREWRSSCEVPRALLQTKDLWDRARDICPADWKRFRSDLLRLELLWLQGGIYVDCDLAPLRPFDPLLAHQAFVPWSPNRGPGGRRLLTQAVLGARRAHPWIGACLAGLPAAVDRYGGRPLAQMIGPHHVTRVWRRHPEEVTVLDERSFGPQSNRDRDRRRPVDLTGAYGWHRWANSRDMRHGGVR